MDTGERLAAYLAGDLDADEARRLEGELARDPSLRSRLARLRRLEESLADLPDVEVPTAFSERLRDALQRELDGRPVRHDELAERRQRRSRGLPQWFPALAGAAAALVAVVAVGTVLTGGMGGEDGDAPDEGAAEMAETAMGTEEAGEALDSAAGTLAQPDGPAVADLGGSYDAEGVEALAGLDPVRRVVDQRLADEAATETARRYTAALEGVPARATAEEGSAQGDGTETAPEQEADRGDDAAGSGGAVQRTGDVSDSDLEAVRSCLPEVLSADEPLIPTYAELATFDGVDAIVYGLVAHDPDTGAFTRVQIWVVDRDGCEVLYFAQAD